MAGLSRASSSEVCYHGLTEVGTCRLGPLFHLPPSLATVAAIQMDAALRRLEMRLCSCCQYCGAHFSEEAAFRYLGSCQILIIKKILNLSVFLKKNIPCTLLSQAPNCCPKNKGTFFGRGFCRFTCGFCFKIY